MLRFEDWGSVEYQLALERQLERVQEVIDTQIPGVLVFCTHPPVATLGRKTQPEDLSGWQGSTIEVSRGGRVTYHGPSQLVIYPIVNLELSASERKAKDIDSYLRHLEQAIVETLKTYGVEAVGKSRQKKSEDENAADETGVWVGSQKIASLGIAIKKWVSYHGAAINLDEDPMAFSGMRPCGFSKETMVSLEKLLGKKINRQEFSIRLQELVQKNLS
ncbi:MAG: lipoyl(octanoyl) transferase [Bdellovibrio sp. CG10_big_fil_rev_8_21_14_0_10_47_8]|nr:MAG: lipoyl(octanoyl) transferase [Bdellovibrio sp. CG10_big_fil_rev_8_21_14_0_10_47_8]